MASFSIPPDYSEARQRRSVRTPPRKALPRRPTVVAFDPGGTTGWAVMTVHPEALSDPDVKVLENITLWTHGQIDCGSQKGNDGRTDSGISTAGESAGLAEMVSLIDAHPGAAVLSENFIIRQFNKSHEFLAPVRLMSVLDFVLWQRGLEMHRQQPSEAKTTATDARLKDWDLYIRNGGENHARDADRHAVTFLRKAKSSARFRAKAWPHIYGVDAPYGPARAARA